MRIPFIRRKEEDIRSIAARATYVGGTELQPARMRDTRTLEEIRAARRRRERLLNGEPPPS
jgi:hypothetical protein